MECTCSAPTLEEGKQGRNQGKVSEISGRNIREVKEILTCLIWQTPCIFVAD